MGVYFEMLGLSDLRIMMPRTEKGEVGRKWLGAGDNELFMR